METMKDMTATMMGLEALLGTPFGREHFIVMDAGKASDAEERKEENRNG